jgi:hypothetical protein
MYGGWRGPIPVWLRRFSSTVLLPHARPERPAPCRYRRRFIGKEHALGGVGRGALAKGLKGGLTIKPTIKAVLIASEGIVHQAEVRTAIGANQLQRHPDLRCEHSRPRLD